MVCFYFRLFGIGELRSYLLHGSGLADSGKMIVEHLFAGQSYETAVMD
jgi:hypothetical protein